MEKIDSFKVNHLKLKSGLYVSRKDAKNEVVITTFDMRITAPNVEECIDAKSLHTIEHLGATFLRNSYFKNEVVYFGPMGCRTGFYFIAFGDLLPTNVFELVIELCDYVINFEGNIPGASQIECGNFSEQNLSGAKKYMQKYKNELLKYKRFNYPN